LMVPVYWGMPSPKPSLNSLQYAPPIPTPQNIIILFADQRIPAAERISSLFYGE